jgi:hypothetical protein
MEVSQNSVQMMSLDEAAHALNMSRSTLIRWLKIGSIECIIPNGDRRRKQLTREQLQDVAAISGRPIRHSDLGELEQRQSELERRQTELERMVSVLWENHESRQLSNQAASVPIELVATSQESQVASTYSLAVDARQGLDLAIQFLEEATRHSRGSEAKIVFITFLSEKDSFILAPTLRREWLRALRKVLESGWHIVHLIRSNQDPDRALGIVEDVIELAGISEHYWPIYVSENQVITPDGKSWEVIVILDVGALELSSSQDPRYLDKHEMHGPSERYEELRDMVENMRFGGAPLLEIYPKMSVQFSDAIARADEQSGDCGLFLNGLSELTVPLRIHDDRAKVLLKSGGGEHQRIRKLLESRKRRVLSVEDRLRQSEGASKGAYCIRHIYPMGAVRRYIETGIYSPDDIFFELGADPLSPQQRREHLENVITWLRTYKNFHLGLLDDDKNREDSFRTFWMVKSKSCVLMETGRGTKRIGGAVDIEIKDPITVQASYEHFMHLWGQLDSWNTEKSNVIAWLETQIRHIPLVSSLAE